MAILILAQHDNKNLHPATLSTVTAATKLGDSDIHLLVAGYNCDNLAKGACQITGITKLLKADAAHYEYFLAEELAPLIMDIIQKGNYNHILAPATSFGKNILPRIAALLDVQQISDVTHIIDENTFIRPVYTGNALAKVQSNEAIKALTIRATVFEEAAMYVSNAAPIEQVQPIPTVKQSRFIQRETIETERPELTTAKIVIAGGHALGSIDDFKMIETLADKLGGAVGATRAAVDAGYIPNDAQIGQTGKLSRRICISP